MAPATLRAFAAAHARLEHTSRAAWMVDARTAVWAKDKSFKDAQGELRRGE